MLSAQTQTQTQTQTDTDTDSRLVQQTNLRANNHNLWQVNARVLASSLEHILQLADHRDKAFHTACCSQYAFNALLC